MEDKTFQKAFNAGYLLEKYVPALCQLLIRNFQDSENDFFAGFQAGSQEYLQEKTITKSRLMAKLNKIVKGSSKSKKEKEDREFDREK